MATLSNSFDELIADSKVSDIVLFFQKFRSIINHEKILFWKFYQYFQKKGKVSQAKIALNEFVEHALKFKRIPLLKKLLIELNQIGEVELAEQVSLSLQKFTGEIADNDSWHLKNEVEVAIEELIYFDDWSLNVVKKVYEFILRYSYDHKLFGLINANISEKHKDDWRKFQLLFAEEINEITEEKFKIDYDLIALSKISGEFEIDSDIERNVIISLKYDLENKSFREIEEMAIAFKMLSMDKAVNYIVEHAKTLKIDVEQKASLLFIKIKSDYDAKRYLDVTHEVETFLQENPLIINEKLPLMFLAFEAFLKLKKSKKAKEMAIKINELEKGYRKINERIKEIE